MNSDSPTQLLDCSARAEPLVQSLTSRFTGRRQERADALRELLTKTDDRARALDRSCRDLTEERDALSFSLTETHARLSAQQEVHAALVERHQFIVDILAARPTASGALQRLHDWLREDFAGWIHALPLGAIGADALHWAQSLADRLEVRERVPDFRGKTIVAVAGGFSSGKSSFITSLMQDPTRGLPVGIEPVTAIPTYVIAGSSGRILGHTARGGAVSISPRWYERLSHHYLKTLGFRLQSILPFVTMETPLHALQHLAFIDLPGFDAAATRRGHEADDDITATEFLRQAQRVIWAVGLDVNGTVPQADLETLISLAGQGKSLYLLLTKADLRSATQLHEVLDHVEALLAELGLPVLGISVFSNVQPALADGFRGMSLREALRQFDEPNVWESSLQDEVDLVFEALRDAVLELKVRNDHLLRQLKGLELDLLERPELLAEASPPSTKPTESSGGLFSALQTFLGQGKPEAAAPVPQQEAPDGAAVSDAELTQRLHTLRSLILDSSHSRALQQAEAALQRLQHDLSGILNELKDGNGDT